MPRPSPTTPEQDAEMVALYQTGTLGRNSLAKKYGAGRKLVTDRLRTAGVNITPSREACKAVLRHDAFADAENDAATAYWVGFLMADGCISEHRHSTYVVLVLGEADRGQVQAFLDFLGSSNGIRELAPRGLQVNRCYRADLASKQMASDLARYGVIPRKTKTAEVKLLEHNRHFWRGVIDGDGSLGISISGKHKKPRPVLQLCGSERLTEQFADFAAEMVGATARPHPSKSIFGISLTCGPAYEMVKVLYRPGDVSLPRKRVIAERIAAECRPAWRRDDASKPHLV